VRRRLYLFCGVRVNSQIGGGEMVLGGIEGGASHPLSEAQRVGRPEAWDGESQI